MVRVFLLILVLGLSNAQESRLKIKDKIFTIVPQIPKDYSITAQIHPIVKQNKLTVPVKVQVKKQKQIKPFENSLLKEKVQEEEEEINFVDFHKIKFEATQNYQLHNVNDESVIDSKGKIITQIALVNNLQGSTQSSWATNQNTDQSISNQPLVHPMLFQNTQNQPEIVTPFIQPPVPQVPETPFMPPSATKTISSENSNEILTGNRLKTNLRVHSQTSWVQKIGFSLMIGVSVIILMCKGKKEKNRPGYIPTNDDQVDTFN